MRRRKTLQGTPRLPLEEREGHLDASEYRCYGLHLKEAKTGRKAGRLVGC